MKKILYFFMPHLLRYLLRIFPTPNIIKRIDISEKNMAKILPFPNNANKTSAKEGIPNAYSNGNSKKVVIKPITKYNNLFFLIIKLSSPTTL